MLIASLVFAVTHADENGYTPRGALANELSITLEQADAVLGVLEQCGVSDFDKVEHDDLLDDFPADGNRGYRLDPKGNEANNVILYMGADGTVNEIRWADNTLFADGKVVAKLYHDLVIGVE